MRYNTIENDFEYQAKKILKSIISDWEDLQGLTEEELDQQLWENYAQEVGKKFLEVASDYGIIEDLAQ